MKAEATHCKSCVPQTAQSRIIQCGSVCVCVCMCVDEGSRHTLNMSHSNISKLIYCARWLYELFVRSTRAALKFYYLNSTIQILQAVRAFHKACTHVLLFKFYFLNSTSCRAFHKGCIQILLFKSCYLNSISCSCVSQGLHSNSTIQIMLFKFYKAFCAFHMGCIQTQAMRPLT
jgi:hypothetical protein